jgi:hypothetical protein
MDVSGVVRIDYTGDGATGNGKAVSETMANVTVSGSIMSAGGYYLYSMINDEGHQVLLIVDHPNGTNTFARFRAASVDQSVVATGSQSLMESATSDILDIYVNGYYMYMWRPAAANVRGKEYLISLLKVRGAAVPKTVATAGDNGSGLVRIETSAPHGRTTGDQVFLSGATIGGGYSSNLNGSWTVTVIDATHYDLQSSTWPGGSYDADSARAAGGDEISRCFFAYGSSDGISYHASLRISTFPSSQSGFFVLNQYA